MEQILIGLLIAVAVVLLTALIILIVAIIFIFKKIKTILGVVESSLRGISEVTPFLQKIKTIKEEIKNKNHKE